MALSDGSLYATYRPSTATTATPTAATAGTPGRRPSMPPTLPADAPSSIRAAANFVKKFSNGKFLLWYHNHGGEAVHNAKWDYYLNRNPAWILAASRRTASFTGPSRRFSSTRESDTRMSYPDFIEDGGRFFVTETQKTIARVHEIDRAAAGRTLGAAREPHPTREGLGAGSKGPGRSGMPRFPPLTANRRLHARLPRPGSANFSAGQTIFDARDDSGRGVAITTTDRIHPAAHLE